MIFFLIFPENKIWHFLQIVSSFGKNKKNILKNVSWNFLLSMLSIKYSVCYV